MDREYLEDYEQREKEEYARLVMKRVQEGTFDFEEDRYPPDERFQNLQKPVALTTAKTANIKDVWAQIPFCGSLVLLLGPYSQQRFERIYFQKSEISKIINFIKETGKLQVALSSYPPKYEGLDHLDPFFKELTPPCLTQAPFPIFWSKREFHKTYDTFYTLGEVRYLPTLRKVTQQYDPRVVSIIEEDKANVYTFLKLGRYAVVEDIENLMIDDPAMADFMLLICRKFIVNPNLDLRSDLKNFAMEEIKEAQNLPSIYQPKEKRFPCEIGKFLLKRLTNAPLGIRACYDIIDHYEDYDLMKVQKSLNDSIVTNDPDIIEKSTKEFDEILKNVWNDPTVPKRIKNLRRGIPMSIAAIGSGLSALTGSWEGFLAGLGFSVGSEFLKGEIEGLSEKLAKFFSRSYQANVYDFKKKYKDRIVKE